MHNVLRSGLHHKPTVIEDSGPHTDKVTHFFV